VVLIIAGLIVVLLVALAIWAIVVRNALVRRRNSAQEALQGIDVALEARFDRIAAQKNAAAGAVQREVDTILGATALRTGRPVAQLTVEEKARAADAAQRGLPHDGVAQDRRDPPAIDQRGRGAPAGRPPALQQ
jgi:hypothetical protein